MSLAVSNSKLPNKRYDLPNSQLVITSLLAGATAGALAKTTIAPLDRTKINFQISKVPYSASKACEFIKETYLKEGFFALWRGNSATMVRIIPYSAIQFAAHEQWKQLLGVSPQSPSHIRLFVAGSLAGVTSQSLTYPLDLARARMAVTNKNEYSTLRQVFIKIWREEGVITFYRGYFPTVLGVIPYAGVSFFTYDTLKNAYAQYNNSSAPNSLTSLLFGSIAGMLGQTSSYPLDIVRRRMQTARFKDPNHIHYATILGTIKKIYKDEGIIKGFFKGLSMNWVKGPIAVGISYATYDKIRDILRGLAVKWTYD